MLHHYTGAACRLGRRRRCAGRALKARFFRHRRQRYGCRFPSQNAGLPFDLVAPGSAQNVWIIECGSATDSGSFEEFRAGLSAAAIGATATIASRFPVTNLCAAVSKLLADEGRRAAVLRDGTWPRLLLKLFPLLTS